MLFNRSIAALEWGNMRNIVFIIKYRYNSFNMPSSCHRGRGKERQILVCLWRPAMAAPVLNYLEVYWPCAGELSAVNAIGTQLSDPVNSGLV